MRMRDHLLQLISNRLRVRRAIPAVAVCGTQGVGISPGEPVFRLGHRAYENCTHRSWSSGERLCDSQRRDDLIVLRAAGGENSCNPMGRSLERDPIAGSNMKLRREFLAEQNFFGIVRWP